MQRAPSYMFGSVLNVFSRDFQNTFFQTPVLDKGGLSSVCSKNFVNFCVVLLPVFKPKFLQVQVVSKDGVPIMSLYYTFGGHLCKKNKKNKWSNCCLLRVWRGLEIP